jgi:hypothetical protein
MKSRDKYYVLTALICWFWFAVLYASGCQFLDSPFGFVSDCYNYGINWNAFIVPSGVLVLIATPVCFLYYLLRVLQIFFILLKLGINKLNFKTNI